MDAEWEVHHDARVGRLEPGLAALVHLAPKAERRTRRARSRRPSSRQARIAAEGPWREIATSVRSDGAKAMAAGLAHNRIGRGAP